MDFLRKITGQTGSTDKIDQSKRTGKAGALKSGRAEMGTGHPSKSVGAKFRPPKGAISTPSTLLKERFLAQAEETFPVAKDSPKKAKAKARSAKKRKLRMAVIKDPSGDKSSILESTAKVKFNESFNALKKEVEAKKREATSDVNRGEIDGAILIYKQLLKKSGLSGLLGQDKFDKVIASIEKAKEEGLLTELEFQDKNEAVNELKETLRNKLPALELMKAQKEFDAEFSDFESKIETMLAKVKDNIDQGEVTNLAIKRCKVLLGQDESVGYDDPKETVNIEEGQQLLAKYKKKFPNLNQQKASNKLEEWKLSLENGLNALEKSQARKKSAQDNFGPELQKAFNIILGGDVNNDALAGIMKEITEYARVLGDSEKSQVESLKQFKEIYSKGDLSTAQKEIEDLEDKVSGQNFNAKAELLEKLKGLKELCVFGQGLKYKMTLSQCNEKLGSAPLMKTLLNKQPGSILKTNLGNVIDSLEGKKKDVIDALKEQISNTASSVKERYSAYEKLQAGLNEAMSSQLFFNNQVASILDKFNKPDTPKDKISSFVEYMKFYVSCTNAELSPNIDKTKGEFVTYIEFMVVDSKDYKILVNGVNGIGPENEMTELVLNKLEPKVQNALTMDRAKTGSVDALKTLAKKDKATAKQIYSEHYAKGSWFSLPFWLFILIK